MALWTDQGGYLASLNLSKELRTALKPGLRFRQFCDIKDPEQQGAMHKGATFHWNVYSKVTAATGVPTPAAEPRSFVATKAAAFVASAHRCAANSADARASRT